MRLHFQYEETDDASANNYDVARDAAIMRLQADLATFPQGVVESITEIDE